jgi:hypothetical protein
MIYARHGRTKSVGGNSMKQEFRCIKCDAYLDSNIEITKQTEDDLLSLYLEIKIYPCENCLRQILRESLDRLVRGD